jgi:hypothetical protein
MAKHMIPFGSTQDGDRDLIDLAFSKKKADDRKEWLRHFRVRPRIPLIFVIPREFHILIVCPAGHVS